MRRLRTMYLFCTIFYASLLTGIVHALFVDRPQATVHTTCGPVNGLQKDGAYSFRGMPYALPPIKERRWSAPVPLSQAESTCWHGIYQAHQFADSCYQKNMLNTTEQYGSEDCLYLNVWTPTLHNNDNLPVMVWIHGGDLNYFSGSYPTYSPTEALANETGVVYGVVYVSMNYRLHAFGFMALDVLSKSSPTGTSGNYGFMDQIAALQWVQENIRNFGGNPNQVTVFGQSSGGTSIFALLSSPKAKGLFQKAWIVSGSPILNKTAADASKDNMVFVRNANCVNRSVDCIRSLTAEEVTNATPFDSYPAWGLDDQCAIPTKGFFYGAIATVDGDVVPEPPLQMWAQGHGVDVPILLGTTSQECDILVVPDNVNQWNWTQYEDYIRQRLSGFGPVVTEMALKLYPSGHVTPEYQYTSMATDIRVTCGNELLSLVLAESFKAPVYRYVATSFPSQPVHALGFSFPSRYSFHLWDIFAFFGSIGQYITSPTSSDLAWQQQVRRQVLSFVKTGRPATASW